MSEKIDLPDGGWAVLRDPETVTERQRRPLIRLRRRMLMRAVPLTNSIADDATPDELVRKIAPLLSDADLDAADDIDDLLLVTLIESWSYEQPITVDATLDMPPKVRSVLLEACRPLVGALFGETSDAEVLDPDSPTAPANGSDRQ